MKQSKPMVAVFVLALVIAGGVLAVQLFGDDGRVSGRRGASGGAVTAASVGGGEDGSGGVTVRSRNDRIPAFSGDAGAAARPELVNAPASPAADRGLSGAVTDRVAARAEAQADDAERSSGWRVGQRRRQVEILDGRVERLRGVVAQFRQEGREDLATRQQGVIDRIESRAVELREELTELTAAAEADGTLAEAEQGYEDSAPARTGARAQATAP